VSPRDTRRRTLALWLWYQKEKLFSPLLQCGLIPHIFRYLNVSPTVFWPVSQALLIA